MDHELLSRARTACADTDRIRRYQAVAAWMRTATPAEIRRHWRREYGRMPDKYRDKETQKVRDIMSQHDIPVKALAAYMHVGEETVRRWIRGTTSMSRLAVDKLEQVGRQLHEEKEGEK